MGTEGVFENVEHLDKNIYRHSTALSEHLKRKQRQLSKRTWEVKGGNGHY